MDYGHQYADKKISAVDRELKKTYRTAQKQLKEKLADFEKQFARKDKEKKKKLEAGEITQDEYRDWMTGQVFVRSRWQEQQRMVNAVLLDHNRQAMNIVNTSTFDVFAENYNYSAFLAEQKMVGMFNLYNAEAVARLILGDPQLLPEWNIDQKKDYIWNQQKVNNILRQSIIQGKGIDEITNDLAEGLATKNLNRMRLFARTAITEAENAGRQQQMNDAAEMGIEVKKMWIAVLDNRTRDAHRGLDGEIVPYNEPFHSALGDIMRPGDPTAAPANVYNCRCCMQTIYPKYDDENKRNLRRAYGEYTTEDGEKRRFSYLTTDEEAYQEWKKGKKARGEVQSESIADTFKSSPTGRRTTVTIPGSAKVLHIDPVDFKKHTKSMTQSEIINSISKQDKTDGSCSSVALAYIANKAGYDVHDFRSGESRTFFGMDSVIKQISELKGVKSESYIGKNDFTAAHKLCEKMQVGKEYFLSVGNHVSIVKKTEKQLRYLELQGKEGTNGYHRLDDDALRWRFQCEKVHKDQNDKPAQTRSLMIDIDTLKNNDDFLNIMRYINTREP